MPCVLHTNGAGHKSPLLGELARRSPASLYVPLWSKLSRRGGTSQGAHRLADIFEMRTEERSQPLTNGSILEYGKFAWKETGVNSTYGA